MDREQLSTAGDNLQDAPERSFLRRQGGSPFRRTIQTDLAHVTGLAYARVKIDGGKSLISRGVPAIVDGGLQERARAALAENKRYPDRNHDRKYLLRGLVRCKVCGFACTGRTSTSNGKKYSYYGCTANRGDRGSAANAARIPPHRAPSVSAPWLEKLVWGDVKQFLENPGETLERVREQLAEADQAEELKARHADLTKRLAAKQAEKDRYVRLYAQDHISEDELESYLLDLKNHIGNLRLLVESVETDLSRSAEERLTAESTAAWLLTLRERLAEVEEDTSEAFAKRRQLVGLLVEGITLGRNENGQTSVRTTYRFGPPSEAGPSEGDLVVTGEQNSLKNMAAN